MDAEQNACAIHLLCRDIRSNRCLFNLSYIVKETAYILRLEDTAHAIVSESIGYQNSLNDSTGGLVDFLTAPGINQTTWSFQQHWLVLPSSSCNWHKQKLLMLIVDSWPFIHLLISDHLSCVTVDCLLLISVIDLRSIVGLELIGTQLELIEWTIVPVGTLCCWMCSDQCRLEADNEKNVANILFTAKQHLLFNTLRRLSLPFSEDWDSVDLY